MATMKITVTLPVDQFHAIRERVASGRVASVSAFLKHAVKISLEEEEDFLRMLDESLEKTGGPMTEAETAWADSIIDPKPKKTAKKRQNAA
jgi:Arc/MetJ-type ribon-helix-helix transcriptional regulator